MRIEAYCDESRQQYFVQPGTAGQQRYVLLGSLWLETAQRSNIKGAVRGLRERHQLYGEFRWRRVSPSRLGFYVDLVNLFFDYPLRFRCIVLPADQLNAIQFHGGDNELMFYKFYYLMLQGWILEFNTYRFFLDIKTNRVRQRLSHLHAILQRSNFFAEIANVQALPANQVDLLQLVDVLIGAVGYRFHHDGTSAAKWTVVRTIEERLGHQIGPTSKCEEKFNIFRWRPGGGW